MKKYDKTIIKLTDKQKKQLTTAKRDFNKTINKSKNSQKL